MLRTHTILLFVTLTACATKIEVGEEEATAQTRIALYVTLTQPSTQAVINQHNARAFLVAGECSAWGQPVVLSGAASASVDCANGVWQAVLDLSAKPDGPLSLAIDHADAAGRAATQFVRTMQKDTSAPVVTFLTPPAGSLLPVSTLDKVSVSGTCAGVAPVIISGSVASEAACSGDTFSATFDVSGVPDGSLYFYATQRDGAGNSSKQAAVGVVKYTGLPAVTIASPAAQTLFNAAASTAVTFLGGCTDNGQPVSVSGDIAGEVFCQQGLWTMTLDISSLGDGTFTVNVDHASAPRASRTFRKDAAAPAITFTQPSVGLLVSSATMTAIAVAGSCSEEGATVSITGALSSSAVCTAGNFATSVDATSLPDGLFTLYAVQHDAAGNASAEVSVSLAKDSTLPTVSFLSPEAGTLLGSSHVGAFQVTGACSESGRDVHINGDAAAVVPCTNGFFTALLDLSSASEGNVTLTVRHDNAQLIEAVATSRTFTKDTLPPSVAFTSPAPGSYITASAQTSVEVHGSCSDAGSIVALSGAANDFVPCQAGTFSATFDFSTLADGPVFLFVSTADAAGNLSAQASLALVKDTTLPTVTVSSPAAGAGVNRANAAAFGVLGSCSEPGRPVIVSGDASTTVTCDGGVYAANLDFSGKADGPVTIRVNHTSAGGLSAPTGTRTFTKDTQAPTVAFTTPSSGSGIDSAHVSTLQVSGACSENGRDVVLVGYASAVAICTNNTFTASLDFSAAPQGAVFLYASHDDAVGNAATQAFLPLIKDTFMPSVSIVAPAPSGFINAAAVSTFALNGHCSEDGRNVVISGSASAIAPCVVDSFSATMDLSALSDGPLSFTVSHADRIGNAAPTETRTFIKDTTPPTVAFSSPSAGAKITPVTVYAFEVSGTCSEEGQMVHISGDASASVPCSGGLWTATLNLFSKPDGNITLNAAHADAAGNHATSASRSYDKETIFPAVTISAPAIGTYIDASNTAAFIVTGACSENNRNVVISGAASATVVCIAGTWTATLNFTATADGDATIYVDHSDVLNRPAPQASRVFIKDALKPTIAVTAPSGGSYINAANVTAVAVSGTCTEANRAVTISGHASASVNCGTNGTFSASLNFNSAPQGTVTITLNHADAAGNSATAVNFSLNKDTTLPTVSVTGPSGASYITPSNQSALVLSGSCSENGRTVVISNAASATATCDTSATPRWTATVDVSASAQGALVFYANHSDAAGNSATQASVSITKDTIAPTGTSIAINSGFEVTSNPSVTLTLAASSATQMYVTNTPGCGSDGVWETYATSRSWTLTNLGTDGPPPEGANNTVYVKFRDAALNESPCISDSITHETLVVEPTYRANGAKWNDYVRRTTGDNYHQTDTACSGTETGSQSCLHGGELRKVVVIGETSCTGLTMTETLDAFDWICRDTSSTPAETTATFFSVALKANKYLSDLLDANAFKSNQVIVYKDGNLLRQSVVRAWWSNPVAPLPANNGAEDAVSVLSTPSAIYTVSGTTVTQGYNINADRVAIVGLLGVQEIVFGGTPTFNCASNGETTAPTLRCVISAGTQKHLWFEDLTINGASGGYSGQVGLSLQSVNYSRLTRVTTKNMVGNTAYGFWLNSNTGMQLARLTAQNVSGFGMYWLSGNSSTLDTLTISGGGIGLHLDLMTGNTFSNIAIASTSQYGMYLNRADTTRFTDVTVTSAGSSGVIIGASGNVTIKRLTVANNGNDGVQFVNSGWAGLQITQLRSYNNVNSGVLTSSFSNLRATDVIVANNGASGIYASNSPTNIFTQVTSANNGVYGIYAGSVSSTFHQVLATNNNSAGFYVTASNGNTFSQIFAADNGGYGVQVEAAGVENRFTGNMVIGNNASGNCNVVSGTVLTPGIVTGTCTTTGTVGSSGYPGGYVSNATLRTTGTIASALVGKVTSDDGMNSIDSSGASAFSGVTDWLGFSSPYRNWGRDGSAFPSSDHRGRCSGSQTCRIWDWHLVNESNALYNRSGNATSDNAAFPSVSTDPCPAELNGDRSTIDAAGNRFLLSAIEITGDAIGDDDGLCETGDACLYAPNFGAYQGEGSYAGRTCVYSSAGSLVTGVTLYAYSAN